MIGRQQLDEAEHYARHWLIRAHLAAEGKGFAHSCWRFAPGLLRWNKPYPETSGYLIENFLPGAEDGDAEIARRTADWLCEVQHEEGYFHSGTERLRPSAFNTAQILFGLHAAHRHFGGTRYHEALEKALSWLTASIAPDGKWMRGLYHQDHFATYYSRAVWPMILVSSEEDRPMLRASLGILWERRKSNGFFDQLGFKPGDTFLTHTLAYALEGFLESSILLGDGEIRSKVLESLEIMASRVLQEGMLHGRYDQEWSGVGKMRCVTGQAQMASLLFRAVTLDDRPVFSEAGERLMKELLEWQVKSGIPDYNGGFSASIPVWGSYFPFRMVSWTNKFFLDACKRYRSLAGFNG